MTALNRSTRRRLQTLPQAPNSVWEGDRRALSAGTSLSLESNGEQGECILWVDGSQAVVRAMDVVALDIGPEATVRTLLRAMEQPHSPAKPERPQKIVVRDRELQFFLRGVLQDLNIAIDYVPELPLIDEIFRGFQELANSRPPQLPPQYADLLEQKAAEIWQDAPWELLGEHQIIALEINHWDLGTLYVSIMGMLGMEYGLLLYRSLESLQQFRQQALNEGSMEEMEEAFLQQDCLFMTFEAADTVDEDDDLNLADLPPSDIEPAFGNLHPLEGLRSFLHEEEAGTLLVSLDALHRFFRQHRRKLAQPDFPAINSRYRIPITLKAGEKPTQVSVNVATLPEVSSELFALTEEEDLVIPMMGEGLVPEDCLISLGVISWEMVRFLRSDARFSQPVEANIPETGEGLPVILIQTSLPQAKTLVQNLQEAGGLTAICFNPGSNPLTGDRYDLTLLQTGNGEFHLCGEFLEEDPVHIEARKKWNRRCKNTQGYCGLVIARGLKGASRGNPQFKDMWALFEARSVSGEEVGVGPLELKLDLDWI
ncbi:MAG: hypothetical protein VKJ46_08075 [Leptolyngbyaceae bacterium]|nr:hypothetical protein [Leptolyngbyaceae bacterium]